MMISKIIVGYVSWMPRPPSPLKSTRVFSVAKTVADLFKFRRRVGQDVALEALRDGWQRRRFAMDELWRYARIDRVTRVIGPYLEMLT
jgi:hypothetical protein